MKLDCGHKPTDTGHSFSTGVATDQNGKTMCYSCADSRQAEEMRASDTFGAYLSSDGKNVTTWLGGVLMRVIEHTEARTGFYGSALHYIRAQEATGERWYGKNGGPGMCVTMHRAKSARVVGGAL